MPFHFHLVMGVPLAFLVVALGTIGITGIAATLISGAIAIGLDIGLSLLVGAIAQALTPQPGLKSTLTISISANDPRRIFIGRAATAGQLVSFQSWGNNNEWIALIIRLCDHPIGGVAPQINITGTLTIGSRNVTGCSSVAGVTPGMPIVSFASGQRFPPGTFVTAVPNSSTIVMSNEAVIGLTGTPIVVNCGLYWSGNPVQLGVGGAVPQFFADGGDNCWVTFANGDWNQPADADMVAHSNGRWTADSRGRGVAYMKVVAKANAKAFPNGIDELFQFVAVIDGAALYDPRQDSSAGGSGSQRFNDTSTWTLNANSAVVGYQMLAGFRVEDTTGTIGARTMDQFFGLNLPQSVLPYAENAAAMNACDVAFSLNGGGTEPAYRCNGVIAPNPGDTFETHFADVLATMSGKLVQSPQRIFLLAGAAQTSVRTFHDSDIRLDGPYKFTNDIPLDQICDGVTGQFADPASMFTGQPLPPRLSPTDVAEDGGRPKYATLDLSYVTSETQGQRLQEILRQRQRRQRTAQWAVPPENLDIEAGDWLTWTSPRWAPAWGAASLVFEVVQNDGKGSADLAEEGMIVLDLAEVDANVFAWNPATQELPRQAPKFLPSADPTAVAVTGLTAAATTIATPAGTTLPALAVTTDPLADPTVIAIRFQYQDAGATLPLQTKDFAVNPATAAGTQSYTLSESVVAGYQYSVTAAAIRVPPRDLDWCTPVVTSAVTSFLVLSPNLPINLNVDQGGVFDPTAPLSAPSSTSIAIAATTVTLPGALISLPSGTIAGLTASTQYAVFYDLQSAVYIAAAPGTATPYYTNATRYLAVGTQFTPSGGGVYPSPPPPAGGGGGHAGGDGGMIN